jgi:hypothetical protein
MGVAPIRARMAAAAFSLSSRMNVDRGRHVGPPPGFVPPAR